MVDQNCTKKGAFTRILIPASLNTSDPRKEMDKVWEHLTKGRYLLQTLNSPLINNQAVIPHSQRTKCGVRGARTIVSLAILNGGIL